MARNKGQPRTSPLNAEQAERRATEAFKHTEIMKSQWYDAYKYFLPQRDQLVSNQPGEVKGDEVFDSTGVMSAAAAANRITTLLFPHGQNFIELEPGPAVKFTSDGDIEGGGSRDELNKILKEATDKFHTAIWRSNFGTVSNEFLLDLLIGTGVMMIMEGTLDDPFQFIPVTAPTIALEEGPNGSIGAVFRKHMVPVGIIEEQWPGARGAKLTAELREKKEENPMQEVEILEITHWDKKRRIWFYEIIHNKEKLLKAPWIYEETSPWLVTRWMKAANERWGRGPILYALADTRTANKVVELILKNASLSISGAYTVVDDGVFNPDTAAILPGAMIPVARNNGHPQGASVQPLERPGDFDVSQLLLTELRDNIRRMLFDRALPEESGPVRSATEIIKRLEDLQMDIGAAFGRLMTEMITPMVIRCLRILDSQEVLAFPIKIDGEHIRIKVTSPLAQQQNMEDLKTSMMWLEILGMLGQEFTVLNAKLETFGTWAGEKLGVDPALMRDADDKKKIEEGLQQIMQGIAERAAAAGGQGQGGQGAPGGAPQPAAAQQGGVPAIAAE